MAVPRCLVTQLGCPIIPRQLYNFITAMSPWLLVKQLLNYVSLLPQGPYSLPCSVPYSVTMPHVQTMHLPGPTSCHCIQYHIVTTPSFYLLPLILLLQGATETIEKCFSDGTRADCLVYFVPSLKDLQVLIICRPCFTSGSSSSLTYTLCVMHAYKIM